MINIPLKGFLKKSPIKDIDTTLADKVYNKAIDDMIRDKEG